MKERGNLPLQIYCGGVRRVSDPFQVDAAALVDADTKVDGGAGLNLLSVETFDNLQVAYDQL